MRILIEAHHPFDVHFWKYPVREFLEHGHKVRVIGRDRDVMRALFMAYPWIPVTIPERPLGNNRFPLQEMLQRQWFLLREMYRFRPDVVASMMGSYCQGAALMGIRNVVFTDSEFHSFNQTISHPFADEIHTPACFLKEFGPRQKRFPGIFEQSFIGPDRDGFPKAKTSDPAVPESAPYILIRLCAWNTFHDRKLSGIGGHLGRFIEEVHPDWKVLISAEENKLPSEYRSYLLKAAPDQFHQILSGASLVLTEGASTASEAACMGIPTVYVNSAPLLGYLKLLQEDYGLVECFREGGPGVARALTILNGIRAKAALHSERAYKFHSDHGDVCTHIVKVVEGNMG
jgi:predicted glycosyltransferase